MKNIYTLIAGLLLCATINAHNGVCSKKSAEATLSPFYSSLQSLGKKINDAEIPLLGKLGGILPFAIVGFSLQNFPGQSLFVCASALAYTLYFSDAVNRLLHKCNMVKTKQTKSAVAEQREIVLKDDFFVFDGDDLLDAQEEEDLEEEMLEKASKKRKEIA